MGFSMAKIGGRKRLLSVGGVVLVGLAAAIGVVVIANPASAHTASLSGVATCDPNSGTYSITYTGQSERTDLAGDVTVSGSAPSSTAISPMSLSVPGHGTFTIKQAGIPGDATAAGLRIHVQWPDGVDADPGAEVALPSGCAKAPTPVTATAPTFTERTCDTPAASYVIPGVTGVAYQVDGLPVAAGSHAAIVNSVAITAVAKQDFELTGTAKWTHEFAPAPTHAECAGAASPAFVDSVCANNAPAAASYAIPTDEGVDYEVGGVKMAAGTHDSTSGSTITVTAVAQNGHPLKGTATWTHAFPAAPTDCDKNGTATAPTFTDATCDSPTSSYQIPSSDQDISYEVNGTKVAAGKHTVSGGTVTITAVAAPDYTIVGKKTWQHAFDDATDVCPVAAGAAPVAAPPADVPAAVTPATLANTGPGAVASKGTIVGLLLALLGMVCLFAGRRPATGGRHAA